MHELYTLRFTHYCKVLYILHFTFYTFRVKLSLMSSLYTLHFTISGGWARDDEEDGGKALNARQEEDGRQKPIRQPESRVPSFSQLFRPLEDQDTARNECEKKN